MTYFLTSVWKRLGIFVLDQKLTGPDNILAFAGHVISIATTELCSSNEKAANNMQYLDKWICLCSSKTLFSKTGSVSELIEIVFSILYPKGGYY